MKTYKVRDSQVVVILSKPEAALLLRLVSGDYVQKTKLRAAVEAKVANALTGGVT